MREATSENEADAMAALGAPRGDFAQSTTNANCSPKRPRMMICEVELFRTENHQGISRTDFATWNLTIDRPDSTTG
jgi:hypothetical protein